jgi:hypothetical protein
MGMGGSILQWHPEKKVGFGYVPFELAMMDDSNVRGKALQVALMKCIEGNVPVKSKSATCAIF